MYPQYNNLPDHIARQVNPSSPSSAPSSSSSFSFSPPHPSPNDDTNPSINSLNKQISAYLHNPTKTWLAVQKSKRAGARLVYYYEPEDQFIHFASNGLPVHDQHFFDGEAGFFEGVDEDEEVGAVEVGGGEVRRSDGDGCVSEGEGKAVEGDWGDVDMDGDTITDVRADAAGVGRKEETFLVKGKDSAVVCEAWDCENGRDLCLPLGMIECVAREWDGGRCGDHDEEHFAWKATPSVVASEQMGEVVEWREERNGFLE